MWQKKARCLNENTEYFYPPRDKDTYQDYASKARAFCYGRTEDEGLCPVIVECLVFALEREEVHGIWGGLSSRERSGLRTRLSLPKWLDDNDTESTRRIHHAIHVLRSSQESSGD